MLDVEGPQEMRDDEDMVHLVNRKMCWELRETANGTLTGGLVSEDLQRDRIRQIVQWLRHFPDRLPEMEALTPSGREALSRVRAKGQKEAQRDAERRWGSVQRGAVVPTFHNHGTGHHPRHR